MISRTSHVVAFRFILAALCIVASLLSSPSFAFKSESFTLKNGLRVVIVPGTTPVPVICHMVWYKVGSIDEHNGKSGLAHFLEHLMFKGTTRYPDGQFSSLIAKAGGNENAFTNQNYTGYYQTLSKDQLELAIRLEADRMHHLVFEQDRTLRERDVILEERRQRIDNVPQQILAERMRAKLFADQPDARPVIGWEKDMRTLSPEDAKAWYTTYYKPNDAIVVIAGNITKEEAEPLIRQYYGSLKSGDLPERPSIQPDNKGILPTESLRDSRVSAPELSRYYSAPITTPSAGKQPSYALTVLSYILGTGQTSLLYQTFVRNNALATSANSNYDDIDLGRTIFSFHLTLKNEQDFTAVEKQLDHLIETMIHTPIKEEDLNRAKQALIAQTIYAQEDPYSLAMIYGNALVHGLTTEYIEQWQDNIQAVTVQDINHAAALVFSHPSMITGHLLPASTPLVNTSTHRLK